MAAESDPTPIPQKRSWFMRLLGVKRRKGKRIPFGFTIWGWILVLGIVGVGGAAAFAEYSMQPDFCRSCHIMEPYYQAWHNSTHKNVSCPECHFEPGIKETLKGKWQASSQAVKYITQTYGSKPHAEIRDASCMRSGCHEKRVLEGKVNWKIKTARDTTITIKFDHTPHLKEERRGKQLRCVSCHSQIVQGQHLVVTLDTCFLCHFKGFEHGRNEKTLGDTGCQACHDAPKSEVRLATGTFKHQDYLARGVACNNCHAEVINGDGQVARQTCWTCHNQASQVAEYDKPEKLHTIHVTEHKVECSSCHVQIEHNLTAASKTRLLGLVNGHATAGQSGACAQCHQSSHSGPLELYRGVGGRGVPDMPSPMFRAQVDCIACHKALNQDKSVTDVTGQTFVAVQDSCNYCHATKYDGVLNQWKKQVYDQLALAEKAYADALAANPSPSFEMKQLLDDADANIKLVKFGHGVHNVNYSTALLNVAIDRSKQAKGDKP
jgi:nitrate/TMAO reductase-like tetraheme cytochrome c subunit